MAPAPATTAASPASPWLFGPVLDLGIGCGLLYVLTVPLFIGLTRTTGIAEWSILWIGLFSTFINTPHYGATLVRVYEQRADRRRYAFFTVWVTLGMMAAFMAGMRSPWLGSALITLYVSWSPWHFSGQNFGLAVMFMRRGGVEIPPLARSLLRTSFFLAFVMAFLALNVEASNTVFAAGANALSDSYRVLSLDLPRRPAGIAFGGVALAYLGCLAVAGILFARVTPWRSLLPVALLVLSSALWFVVPAGMQLTGDVPASALPFAAIWISTAHSAQYLWVSTYYARRSQPHHAATPFLAKSLLAGSAAIVLPGLLFMPALLGSVSWSVGLASLVFSVVNLHHFILDGAIWKLRDGRVARVLLRSGADDDDAGEAEKRSTWFRRVVWVVGAVCVLVPLVHTWELAFGMTRVDDVARLERAVRNLAWIGRDSPVAWISLGAAHEFAGETDPAIEAYRRTLQVDPEHPGAMNRLARSLAVSHADDAERVAEARGLAERAVAIGKQNPYFHETLAIVQAAQHEFVEAERTARHAGALARARGDRQLAAEIEARIVRFEAAQREATSGDG
jgi:hypothetical protein